MKTTSTPRALAYLALVLTPALLPSCQRSSDPSPQTPLVASSIPTNASAAAGPVPCQEFDPVLIPDKNNVGAYQPSVPPVRSIGQALTGMNRPFTMTQTKYIITPSGKEMAVWEGTDTETVPTSKTNFPSTAWSDCGVGYQSNCVRYPSGRVTLSLSGDRNTLPHDNI
jgi:hypothetical protein